MRKFGLIGYPLTHSFSQKYFTEKFSRESIDAVYKNFSIENIDEIQNILQDSTLEGLNVTIPHKESVLKYLDHPSEVVQKIQACNCIRIIDGALYGFNTDIIGFRKHLRSICNHIIKRLWF